MKNTLENLAKACNQFLPQIFPTTLVSAVKKDELAEHYVAVLCRADEPFDNGQFQVYLKEIEVDTIGGMVKKTVFTMTKGVVLRGCHTLPNGDPGYPDDYDVVDVVPNQREKEIVDRVFERLEIEHVKLDDINEETIAKTLFGDDYFHSINSVLNFIAQEMLYNQIEGVLENWSYALDMEEEFGN
jgi:hypothetical protein